MNTPQSGILPDANSSAIFLCVNFKSGADHHALFAEVLAQTQAMQSRFVDADLSSVVSIGADVWSDIFKQQPSQLTPFPKLEGDESAAPSTPYDALIHIRSNRHDVSFELAKTLIQSAVETVEVKDEVAGFKYLDSRDLTGFVDGTENPQGEKRAVVALVEDDVDFMQGSYVHIQRYEHDLPKWDALNEKHQEDIIARSKKDNIEYSSDQKPLTSHIKRVNLKDDEGKSLEVLRHSMPYGTTQTHGLFFVTYAKSPVPFTKMLESMVLGDGEGNVDHLMRYTKAVTGAAFFAPSVEFLENAENYV